MRICDLSSEVCSSDLSYQTGPPEGTEGAERIQDYEGIELMCGHVGIAGKMELKDEALMRRLLVFDYFRGPDSTGFAALRKDGTHRLAKIASNPLNLFDMKRFSERSEEHKSELQSLMRIS